MGPILCQHAPGRVDAAPFATSAPVKDTASRCPVATGGLTWIAIDCGTYTGIRQKDTRYGALGRK